MSRTVSRRDYIKALAAGGALCGLPDSAGAPRASWLGAAGAEPAGAAAPGQNALETEIRRRAQFQLRQRRLAVDYYRIRRKLSYPLPVPDLSHPGVSSPTSADYPWPTWMLWTLEERITCLGWAAEWLKDEKARTAATADLAALAQWPEYRGNVGGFELSSAHAARILATASTRWRWVGEDLRRSLREACRRHVECVLPGSDKRFAAVRTKQDVLRAENPYALMHNIPFIGTIGAAITAGVAQHPAAAPSNARVQALFAALLDLRAKGFSEGLAYDGYLLDFIADWLAVLPAEDRRPILDDPRLERFLEQSYMLAAPGTAAQVAELSDVEPREMPFHLSAQAKLLRLRRHPVRAWLLARCALDWLRTDALAALHEAQDAPPRKTPPAGALDAHYAVVLRSGWEAEDLAVAVSCSNSPAEHVHRDNGTLVIGTHGNWIIADPGYQQYARGEEREFTLGPTAHNAPVINGLAQTEKRPRRIVLENVGPNVHRTAIDLAACYPPAASLKTLVRHVWLSGKNLVVVADQVEAESPPQVSYHWHGHLACAWWFEANWALLALDGVQLWCTSPQARVSGANLQRLPGSRGQLSLVATIDKAGPVVWWAFVISTERPVLRADPDARQIRILDKTFRV